MNILLTIVAVILFFVILIVPHEFGHYITSKMLGVGVTEFSFGMGPALFKYQGPETLYSIRAFPIGGYCALEGENEDTGSPKAFNTKPAWKKLIILLAGVTMNVITAYLIVLIITSVRSGDPVRSIGLSFQVVGEMFKLIWESFAMLFGGELGFDSFSGPVGIVQAVSESVSENVIYFFVLTATMCINLAIVNILPFPALDGGRILFVIIRKITGKMISDELEARIHAIGMVLLLLLILFVTFNDVTRGL